MKKIILALTILLSIQFTMYSTGQNSPSHRIIIDTDCAPDDLRAINLLLSAKDTEVLAITSIDGTLEPEEGFMKIKSLLKYLGHEGIPVSQGMIARKDKNPEWRDIAQNMKWGEKVLSYREPLEIKEFLIQTIEKEEEPVELVCLGPLTNIANAIIMKPEIKSQIKRIIWFDQCQPDDKWTNYGMDCLSAGYLLNKDIPVITVRNGEEPVKFSKSLHESIGQINTPYAKNIFQTHASEEITKEIEDDHLKIWDELASLYLLKPDLFEEDESLPDSLGTVMKVKSPDELENNILHLLKSYNINNNLIFQEFPEDTSLYKKELRPFAKTVINKYGLKEWKAAVMTTEIHGHIGIYSIIGAKMGVRALEYFRALPENLHIQSYTGNKPPLSCMNDGLQVSSGCTFGNGSFKITGNQNLPEAVIGYKNQEIRIQLEIQYLKEIQKIISREKEAHGLDSQKYWENIKKEALKIWEDWDRKEIFNIEEI
ncbi:MAG: nucleoside hydrolase [Bacteroidales bacterium]